jgi:hypothetical protein
MNGILVGLAMLVSSTAGSPPIETPRAVVAPAVFTFDLPASAVTRDAQRVRPAQPSKAKRFSTTDKIIAVAAGVSVGWVVGGGIGFKLTSTSNPDDDISGLRGVIIGAPIGAAVGAILGYRLTR